MLSHHLPVWLFNPLFGDRKKFGTIADEKDPHWIEWQERIIDFYVANQKTGIGNVVNEAGYAVLKDQDFTGQIMVEIGPGSVPHLGCWKHPPQEYIAVDISDYFLTVTAEKMHQKYPECTFKPIKQDTRTHKIDLPDNSVDGIVTFYSLEHLQPLDDFLDEYERILKPGGRIIGAIPNEGGLAWGLGRLITSRRWVRKNTTINYDKIICWEHPNFVADIIKGLEQRFEREVRAQYPLALIPSYDCNLVTKFIYRKKG